MYGIVLLVCILPFSITQQQIPFDEIVIFGDSLSDTGNVFALTNDTYPFSPYWDGRFSNGPNWVDQLNIPQVKISNYAHGSATTDSNFVQGYTKWNTIPVPGLLQQVYIYLNNVTINEINFTRTLYIVWGGGNDFLGNTDLFPSMIVASLFKTVNALLEIGAKNILVFNQVPVQYFPFSKPYESPELFTFLTDEGNFYISIFRKATLYDNPQASIEIFDVHSIILNIITKNPQNFTNIEDNCWEYANQTFVSQLCSNPNDYLFVDLLHLTNRAHGIVADALRSYLFNSYQTSTTSTSVTSPVITSTELSTSPVITSTVPITSTVITSTVPITSTVITSTVPDIFNITSTTVGVSKTTTVTPGINGATTFIPLLNTFFTLIVFLFIS